LDIRDAVVLLIGDELLEGRISDSNLSAAASALDSRGVKVAWARVVPDSPETIASAVREAAGPDRIVVTTGGLGPTDDDLTLASVASAFGLDLVADPEATSWIRSWYSRRGADCPRSALRQAMLPRGAVPVHNDMGVAPGVVLRTGDATVLCLPGVPREAEALLPPCLDAAGLARGHSVGMPVLRTWGIPETILYEKIASSSVCAMSELAFLPRPGLVDLKVRGYGGAALADALAALLGEAVYAREWKPLEAVAGDELEAGNLTLSVAESCTGGLLGGRITSVPGSSGWFLGGVIAYSNYLKRKLLAVPAEILAESGAVSEAAARAMAEGVRQCSGSDTALAVTGVAGPGGGTESRPVGTVWMALEGPGFSEAREWRFGGNRHSVREASAACALGMLVAALRRGRG
jgi:nicotinamide-nucleotide amidase